MKSDKSKIYTMRHCDKNGIFDWLKKQPSKYTKKL